MNFVKYDIPSKKTGISIIIPVLNRVQHIKNAIESVFNQEEIYIELIVIDGGSTDGTLDILHSYSAQITYLSSEPDSGIYEAMNKGISLATNEWLYFLGADDILLSGSLYKLLSKSTPNISVIFGDVVFSNGHRMKSFLGKRTWLQNTLHHQSAIYRNTLFNNFQYDNSLKILGDYELNLRIYSQSYMSLYIPVIVAQCATGGASSQLSLSLKETNIIRLAYIRSRLKNNVLSFMLYVYYAQKKIRSLLYGHEI